MAVLKLLPKQVISSPRISVVKSKPTKHSSTSQERLHPETRLAKLKPSKVGLKGVGGPGTSPGKTLMSCIKDELDSFGGEDEEGNVVTNRQMVAKSMVRMAKSGSFAHINSIIEREEGKVPDRVANADGSNLKWYGTMPLDGPEAP